MPTYPQPNDWLKEFILWNTYSKDNVIFCKLCNKQIIITCQNEDCKNKRAAMKALQELE